MTLALEHGAPMRADARRIRAKRVTLLLVVVLVVTSVVSVSVGASEASLTVAVLDLLQGRELSDLNRIILWDVRLSLNAFTFSGDFGSSPKTASTSGAT